MSSYPEIFLVFLRLGCMSFGGPVAHLGYFHQEFVANRRWLSEEEYTDLVALCQFLPGPASSQVGFAIGLKRGGILGAFLAWVGFTAPTAAILIAFALGMLAYQPALTGPQGWLTGLKLAAVAVVANAVWSLGTKLCPDRSRLTVAVFVAVLLLLLPDFLHGLQPAAIAAGGLWGLLTLHARKDDPEGNQRQSKEAEKPRHHRLAPIWLALFFAFLALSFIPWSHDSALAVAAAFYRSGALVFGGGHVVLPLLQDAIVSPGWVAQDLFVTGYGAAQAMPGPLFGFSAYLGTLMTGMGAGGGIPGGLFALVSLYVPAWLLVLGCLPYWEHLRGSPRARAAMDGANAAVVGILLLALYNPIWVTAVKQGWHLAIVLAAFTALKFWKVPPWLIVMACAAAGLGGSAIGLPE